MSTTTGSSSTTRILAAGAFSIAANDPHSPEMPHFLTVKACFLFDSSWAPLVARGACQLAIPVGLPLDGVDDGARVDVTHHVVSAACAMATCARLPISPGVRSSLWVARPQ